jgi:hypothetical protein
VDLSLGSGATFSFAEENSNNTLEFGAHSGEEDEPYATQMARTAFWQHPKRRWVSEDRWTKMKCSA